MELQVGHVIKIDRDCLEAALLELNTECFDDDEYIFLHEYYEVLTPVATALRTLEGNTHMFGLYLPILIGLNKSLQEFHSKNLLHCNELVAALLAGFEKRLRKFIDIYNGDSLNVPLYLAMVSNPMLKMNFLGFEQRVPAHYINKIRDMLAAEAKFIKRALDGTDNDDNNQPADIQNIVLPLSTGKIKNIIKPQFKIMFGTYFLYISISFSRY